MADLRISVTVHYILAQGDKFQDGATVTVIGAAGKVARVFSKVKVLKEAPAALEGSPQHFDLASSVASLNFTMGAAGAATLPIAGLKKGSTEPLDIKVLGSGATYTMHATVTVTDPPAPGTAGATPLRPASVGTGAVTPSSAPVGAGGATPLRTGSLHDLSAAAGAGAAGGVAATSATPTAGSGSASARSTGSGEPGAALEGLKTTDFSSISARAAAVLAERQQHLASVAAAAAGHSGTSTPISSRLSAGGAGSSPVLAGVPVPKQLQLPPSSSLTSLPAAASAKAQQQQEEISATSGKAAAASGAAVTGTGLPSSLPLPPSSNVSSGALAGASASSSSSSAAAARATVPSFKPLSNTAVTAAATPATAAAPAAATTVSSSPLFSADKNPFDDFDALLDTSSFVPTLPPAAVPVPSPAPAPAAPIAPAPAPSPAPAPAATSAAALQPQEIKQEKGSRSPAVVQSTQPAAAPASAPAAAPAAAAAPALPSPAPAPSSSMTKRPSLSSMEPAAAALYAAVERAAAESVTAPDPAFPGSALPCRLLDYFAVMVSLETPAAASSAGGADGGIEGIDEDGEGDGGLLSGSTPKSSSGGSGSGSNSSSASGGAGEEEEGPDELSAYDSSDEGDLSSCHSPAAGETAAATTSNSASSSSTSSSLSGAGADIAGSQRSSSGKDSLAATAAAAAVTASSSVFTMRRRQFRRRVGSIQYRFPNTNHSDLPLPENVDWFIFPNGIAPVVTRVDLSKLSQQTQQHLQRGAAAASGSSSSLSGAVLAAAGLSPELEEAVLSSSRPATRRSAFVLNNVGGGAEATTMYGCCLTAYNQESSGMEEEEEGEGAGLEGHRRTGSSSSSSSSSRALSTASSSSGKSPFIRETQWWPVVFFLLSRYPIVPLMQTVLERMYRTFDNGSSTGAAAAEPEPAFCSLAEYLRLLVYELPLPIRRLNMAVQLFLPGKTPAVGPSNTACVYLPPPDSLHSLQFRVRPLLRAFKPAALLSLMAALALEQKVMFIARSVQQLVESSETALRLLFPLQWELPYIPVLPAHLATDCLASPVPFVYGLLTTYAGSSMLQLEEEEASSIIVADVASGCVDVGVAAYLDRRRSRFGLRPRFAGGDAGAQGEQGEEEGETMEGGAEEGEEGAGGSSDADSTGSGARYSSYSRRTPSLRFPEPLQSQMLEELSALQEGKAEAMADSELDSAVQSLFLRFFSVLLAGYRSSTFFPGMPPDMCPRLCASAYTRSKLQTFSTALALAEGLGGTSAITSSNSSGSIAVPTLSRSNSAGQGNFQAMLQSQPPAAGHKQQSRHTAAFLRSLCETQAMSRLLQRHTSPSLRAFHAITASLSSAPSLAETAKLASSIVCTPQPSHVLVVPPPGYPRLAAWQLTASRALAGIEPAAVTGASTGMWSLLQSQAGRLLPPPPGLPSTITLPAPRKVKRKKGKEEADLARKWSTGEVAAALNLSPWEASELELLVAAHAKGARGAQGDDVGGTIEGSEGDAAPSETAALLSAAAEAAGENANPVTGRQGTGKGDKVTSQARTRLMRRGLAVTAAAQQAAAAAAASASSSQKRGMRWFRLRGNSLSKQQQEQEQAQGVHAAPRTPLLRRDSSEGWVDDEADEKCILSWLNVCLVTGEGPQTGATGVVTVSGLPWDRMDDQVAASFSSKHARQVFVKALQSQVLLSGGLCKPLSGALSGEGVQLQPLLGLGVSAHYLNHPLVTGMAGSGGTGVAVGGAGSAAGAAGLSSPPGSSPSPGGGTGTGTGVASGRQSTVLSYSTARSLLIHYLPLQRFQRLAAMCAALLVESANESDFASAAALLQVSHFFFTEPQRRGDPDAVSSGSSAATVGAWSLRRQYLNEELAREAIWQQLAFWEAYTAEALAVEEQQQRLLHLQVQRHASTPSGQSQASAAAAAAAAAAAEDFSHTDGSGGSSSSSSAPTPSSITAAALSLTSSGVSYIYTLLQALLSPMLQAGLTPAEVQAFIRGTCLKHGMTASEEATVLALAARLSMADGQSSAMLPLQSGAGSGNAATSAGSSFPGAGAGAGGAAKPSSLCLTLNNYEPFTRGHLAALSASPDSSQKAAGAGRAGGGLGSAAGGGGGSSHSLNISSPSAAAASAIASGREAISSVRMGMQELLNRGNGGSEGAAAANAPALTPAPAPADAGKEVGNSAAAGSSTAAVVGSSDKQMTTAGAAATASTSTAAAGAGVSGSAAGASAGTSTGTTTAANTSTATSAGTGKASGAEKSVSFSTAPPAVMGETPATGSGKGGAGGSTSSSTAASGTVAAGTAAAGSRTDANPAAGSSAAPPHISVPQTGKGEGSGSSSSASSHALGMLSPRTAAGLVPHPWSSRPAKEAEKEARELLSARKLPPPPTDPVALAALNAGKGLFRSKPKAVPGTVQEQAVTAQVMAVSGGANASTSGGGTGSRGSTASSSSSAMVGGALKIHCSDDVSLLESALAAAADARGSRVSAYVDSSSSSAVGAASGGEEGDRKAAWPAGAAGYSVKSSCLTLRGHLPGTAIVCMSHDPWDHRAVTGGQDGRLVLWDMATRSYVQTLEEHAGMVTGVQLCGDLVASGSTDGSVRMAVFNSRARAAEIAAYEEAAGAASKKGAAAAFSASVAAGIAKIGQPKGGAGGGSQMKLGSSGTPVTAVAMWQRPEALPPAYAGAGGGGVGGSSEMAPLSSSSTYLVAAGAADGSLKVWSTEWKFNSKTGGCKGSSLQIGSYSSLHKEAPIEDLQLSSDGRLCVSVSREGRLSIVDVVSEKYWQMEMPSSSSSSSSFRLGGKSSGAAPPQALLPLVRCSIDVSRRPVTVMTAGMDGTARMWDLRSGKTAVAFSSGQPIWCMRDMAAAGGDGYPSLWASDTYLLTGHEDGCLRSWDARKPRLPLTVWGGDSTPLTSLAVEEGGSRAVAGSESGVVRLWDLDAGVCLQTSSTAAINSAGQGVTAALVGVGTTVSAVGLAQDYYLSAGWDGALRCWYPQT